MIYATPVELASRWPNKPDDIADEMILAKLEDASVWLAARYPLPTLIEEPLAGVLRILVCNMVRRSFTNQDFEGVSRFAETAGAFSETTSFYSSGDNLYLTKQEEQLMDSALYGSNGAMSVEMLG